MDNYLKKVVIICLFVIISFLAIKYMYIYLSPFIIAAVLASLINPVVDLLEEQLNLHRGLAVFFVLILVIGILIVLLVLGISQAYVELNKLLQNLPDYHTIGERLQWLINQNNRIQELINELDISESTRNMLNSNLQVIYDGLRDILVGVINDLLGILTKLPLILTILFLSFIATFFISRDKDIINEFFVGLFPPDWQTRVYRIRDELFASAVGFIRAEIILISITGIIAGGGLAITGNQYALVLGLFAALLDLIPVIGPGLLFLPWIIYTFAAGNTPNALTLMVIYLVMAAVRSGAEGKVMGENLGLHPLSIMIALYVGYRLIGPLGFIVAPTLLVILKTVIRTELLNPESEIYE